MTNWLLLRGLSREQRHWESFPEVFATALGDEVTLIDAPGFGTENKRPSPRTVTAITDDIRDRFDRGGKPWSILSISLGGMITLDWCARHPDDFDRAVIINSSTRATRFDRRFKPSSLPDLALGRFKSDLARERAIIDRTANHPGIDRAELAGRWAGYLTDQRPSNANLANQMIAGLSFKMPARVYVPSLVLAAENDRLVHYSASQTIADRLGAPIRIHPTAGHDIPLDDGAWIADQVRDWLAE